MERDCFRGFAVKGSKGMRRKLKDEWHQEKDFFKEKNNYYSLYKDIPIVPTDIK